MLFDEMVESLCLQIGETCIEVELWCLKYNVSACFEMVLVLCGFGCFCVA